MDTSTTTRMKRKAKTVITPEQHGRAARNTFSPRFFCLAAPGLIALFLFASGNIAAGQGTYGKESRGNQKPYALIFGTVWSPNGQPVYGIEVNIRCSDKCPDHKKHHWEVYSDHNGEFAQRVPAGAADYVVSSSLKGSHLPKEMKFKDAPELTVHIDNDERQDIGLHLQ